MNAHLSLSTTVLLTPRRMGLKADHENSVEVLVRVQAPDAPEGHVSQRPPQAISLVIDRSGSMAGKPLAEARRCAEFVAGMMRPTDSVSLVQFDNRVERLYSAVPRGDGTALSQAIAAITDGGSTNLHGGWLEGAETLGDVAGSGLKRVILLSDGQANQGLTESAAIAGQCTAWSARGITTSTYGLGESFNEDLMVAMARAGAGNHYYGDTAEDLMDPFRQELELLGNLCLRDLRLKVTTPDGVEVQSTAAFDGLVDDELVQRRLVELAAANALSGMRVAAGQGDWAAVDRMLADAQRQFAGSEWVAAMLESMKAIADSRSRQRMMKESMYSSRKLQSRLAAKEESVMYCVSDEAADQPAYLRRKPAQGKGDV